MKIGVTVGILAVLLIAAVAVSIFYFTGSQSDQTTNENGSDSGGSGDSLTVPYPQNDNNWTDTGVCTQDAKMCPDGSFVGRVPPTCEFAACPQSSENQVFVVEVTSSGFSPQTLEISQGDTVTWTNQNSASSWPASAIHPTHTLYPGFDSKRGLKNGESYSFTFDKAGTWGYHDHLSPSTKGTIVVK